jgi:3-hydroxyphenylacetate 6-hydroxylase
MLKPKTCKELLKYGNAGAIAVDPMPVIQRLSLSLALTLNWGIRMDSQEDKLFDEITHVEEEVSRFRSTTGNLQLHPSPAVEFIQFWTSKGTRDA